MKDMHKGNIFSIGDKMKFIVVKASLAELEIEVVPQVVMEEGF